MTYNFIIIDSVTAYEIKDDAQETGELDYVNGGVYLPLYACYFFHFFFL